MRTLKNNKSSVYCTESNAHHWQPHMTENHPNLNLQTCDNNLQLVESIRNDLMGKDFVFVHLEVRILVLSDIENQISKKRIVN